MVLRLINALPPTHVAASSSIPFSRFGVGQSWTYDGDDMAVVITINDVNTKTGLHVSVSGFSLHEQIAGLKGAMHHASLAKTNLNEDRTTVGENSVNGGYLQVNITRACVDGA